ncbi:MAG: SAM-dependent DNA methyltransferase [Phycisphaeraceae bacterium]|nr:SAM-dependent DNA methyltransferase [Phycisphaeraceae bacterium]
MESHQLNWIANFIWGIADDVLRDVYVRGKYRDVILPMVVIRRLDAVLEPTKAAVLKMRETLDRGKIANQDAALKKAAGQAFYNASPFTLRELKNRGKASQLKADFEAYLDGFSDNVKEILGKFKFHNQIPTLHEHDLIGALIEKFLDRSINLSPQPVKNDDGTIKLPALDNHAMGTVFEELIRRFNEENNEEAGEHFTPRDVVALMADLIFVPIAKQIKDATYTVYDGACGTGGMLTVAEDRLRAIAKENGKSVEIHLYGQEVNAETYAITKADLLLKGEGNEAENFRHGSTLSSDGFPGMEFNFMLSNPPYGKSWKTDLEKMGGKDGIKDPRFIIDHAGDPEYSLLTRSSDGQLLFLVNKLAKMKADFDKYPFGSRIAEVHNGSSLFTGDAGQGESNIRRWIIENDWLEAIIALPLNMFYNTGIATYIWVLTNRKPKHRVGKVQLIDATAWSKPLRKNLGKKNCELSVGDIAKIMGVFMEFKDTPESKIFPNEAFGYWKITVERPLRLAVDLSAKRLAALRAACKDADEEPLANLADRVAKTLGPGPHMDANAFFAAVEADADEHGVKTTAKRLKVLREHLCTRDEKARPIIARTHKPGKAKVNPIHGLFPEEGGRAVIDYEPDSDLRDTEQVPLLESGGISAFFEREVKPHAPDAWIDAEATKIGYEVSFTRYFYKPPALRTLEQIRADILALEAETEGLLSEIVGEAAGAGKAAVAGGKR